jgi:serine/threonine-protein kinase
VAFDRVALEALAESVGDGRVIDWAAVEAQANEDQRPIVRQLRVLESLAHLHRTLPPVEEFTTRRLDRSLGAPAIGNWGHLALLERLGGGTFGDVYRAWDAQLEREVALKLLRGDAPDSSRLVAEGRLLARVRHEHVVTVHGVGEHDGRVGLWMELVRGVTLEQLLASNGVFEPKDAARCGVDLCHALRAIHDAGLIHRDVKAQNVVREDGGRIVLMDLGTGRDLARGESAVGVAGTPLYLAPEIFAGGAASPRSDIYSLGVLLYHLVTGEYPVRALNFDLLKQAHVTKASVPLRERRPDLPVAFTRAIDRAIAHDPDERYRTVGEFEAALSRVIEPAPFGSYRFRLVFGAFAVVVFVAAGWSAIRPGARFAPRNAAAGIAAPVNTIAVLPFRNDSGDPAQDFFSDGMTDEIISTLGQIGTVNVISRTSTAQFRGMQRNGVAQTLPEIAKALHADTIVEGSIAVTGGNGDGARKVRIHARLIAAGTDTQIWNRTFEAVADDVATLKGEVAQAIAEGIRLRLSPTQQGTIAAARQHQPDFEAFNLYLQGRAAWAVRTKASVERSIELFQQAIALDPKYAAPHAGIADAYRLMNIYGWMPFADAIPRSADEAAKALALDASSSDAHVSMGHVHDSRFQFDAAEASFKRAIELNPANATAHHWYGLLLAKRGAFPQATAEIERARAIDPMSPNLPAVLASLQVQQGNYDDAVARLERVVADQPKYARAHYMLAFAHARAGRYDRALAETDRTAALGSDTAELRNLVGCIMALSGRTTEARAILADVTARYQNARDGSPANIATLHAALGEIDRAFEWLERARTEYDPNLSYLRIDPWFTPLKNDPRYQRLLATLGLTR